MHVASEPRSEQVGRRGGLCFGVAVKPFSTSEILYRDSSHVFKWEVCECYGMMNAKGHILSSRCGATLCSANRTPCIRCVDAVVVDGTEARWSR